MSYFNDILVFIGVLGMGGLALTMILAELLFSRFRKYHPRYYKKIGSPVFIFPDASILSARRYFMTLVVIFGLAVAGVKNAKGFPKDPKTERLAGFIRLTLGVGMLCWLILMVMVAMHTDLHSS